jgi:twitching motility protein PilT
MQTGRDVGMVKLNDSLIELVKAKKVEPLEAYMKAVQKPELKAALQKLGFQINVTDDKD